MNLDATASSFKVAAARAQAYRNSSPKTLAKSTVRGGSTDSDGVEDGLLEKTLTVRMIAIAMPVAK
jgi:hypothetical protein